MDDDMYISRVGYSRDMARVLRTFKRRDRNSFNDLHKLLEKVIREPILGKPLRYSLKNRRRVHLGSYVLVYEINDTELRFLDFDHHDRIYKKYR